MFSPVNVPIKPAMLRPGDTVGVVAPGSPPRDYALLEKGIAWLEGNGLCVRRGRHLTAREGYLAGSDEQRAADLMDMFADPDVRAVLCARGGYGALRLLPLLDYDLIAANPKVLLGFSDNTALLLAVYRLAGLVTFHGPMVAGDFGRGPDDFTATCWRRALFNPEFLGPVPQPAEREHFTLRGGRVSGRLVGGNLSLITSMVGTPYEVSTDGCILLIEEVGEPSYRIDRMLWQLRQAGKLDGIAGLVFGECVGCGGEGGTDAGFAETLRGILGDPGVPAVYGLAFGHGRPKATVPIGVMATLDADVGVLAIEESCVENR